MPPVNHPLSMAETIQNERCAQKMAADKEETRAWQQEAQRKISEGKRQPLHDVPPDPAECQATAGLTELIMETDGVTQEQARARQAADIVKMDRSFNVHTRYDQCPQSETQLIYRVAEEIRHPRLSR